MSEKIRLDCARTKVLFTNYHSDTSENFCHKTTHKHHVVKLIESFVEFSPLPKYFDAFVSYFVTMISWKDGQFDNKVNASACLR